MSYDSAQSSSYQSQPVELYEFYYGFEGSIVVYRYNSTSEVIRSDGHNYLPVPISVSDIVSQIDSKENNITLSIGRGNEVWSLFSPGPLRQPLYVKIFDIDLFDGTFERVLNWSGVVLSGSHNQNDFCDLACESSLSSLRNKGLNRPMSRQCSYTVYFDERCNADIDAATIQTASYTVISPTLINVPAAALNDDGWYAGGFMSYTNATAGIVERIGIRQSVLGGNMSLADPIIGLVSGAQIKLTLGCSGTRADCKTKHNNLLNFGGAPDKPNKNPYSGIRIF